MRFPRSREETGPAARLVGEKIDERSDAEMMTPNFTQDIARQRHAEAIRAAERERLAAQVDVGRETVLASLADRLRKRAGRRPASQPHVAASS
jgi:hypothetical protein